MIDSNMRLNWVDEYGDENDDDNKALEHYIIT